jgi:hypothetical protein
MLRLKNKNKNKNKRRLKSFRKLEKECRKSKKVSHHIDKDRFNTLYNLDLSIKEFCNTCKGVTVSIPGVTLDIDICRCVLCDGCNRYDCFLWECGLNKCSVRNCNNFNIYKSLCMNECLKHHQERNILEDEIKRKLPKELLGLVWSYFENLQEYYVKRYGETRLIQCQ